MPAQVFGAAATVLQLNQAFLGIAPRNAVYENQKEAASQGASAFAISFGQQFVPASGNYTALSNTILTNLNLTAPTIDPLKAADLAAALPQLLALHAGAIGQVVLNLTNLLRNLETDVNWGAAAVKYNNQQATGLAYSSDSSSAVDQQVTDASGAGQTFTLTAGIDIRTGSANNDTFDGSVNANGTATLTSVDVLDGAGGIDSLIAEMSGSTIAPTVRNIEALEIIAGGTAASTFNMVNVSNSPTVTVRNSNQALTIDGFGGNSINLRDQAQNVTVNVTNASAVGANTFTVNLSGAQKGAGNGPTVTLDQQAGADTSGLETVAVASGGSNANFLTDLISTTGGASRVTAVNVTGAQALTINNALNTSVKTLNASAATGGVSASLGSTTTATVTGGSGNDSFTFTASAGNLSVDAGAGNDVVAVTGGSFNTLDTIAGGDGTDRLDLIATDAEAIAATLTNVSGFEQLSLNTAATAAASINASRFGSIDTVRLSAGTLGVYGVTMAAGNMNLQFSTTATTLGGALTVTDTGTASTDSLTITNRNNTSATNNFNAQNITSAGYENVTINTGGSGFAQSIGTVTITGDATNTPQTLAFTGGSGVSVGGISGNSSALLTVNASGMTAQAAGTATFTMVAPTFSGATGTVSIVGSGGQDVLIGHTSAANTIDGGAGVDTVTGGSGADSLAGGDGNDTITSNGGNDTVSGGAGNDTITMGAGTVNVDAGAGTDRVLMGTTLSAGDTVVGGDGTDTIVIGVAAAAGVAAGVSGFETLEVDGNVTQDVVQFTGNTGFTTLRFGATAGNTITFSNVGDSVATLRLPNVALTGGTLTRLVDTLTNTLALDASGLSAARIVTALSIANEETVTLSTASGGAGDLTITTLTADDLTSLTISGGSAVTIGTLANAANLATINAVGNTDNISISASASVTNMTITGSLVGTNSLTGGTGVDVISGGDGADTIDGGNGGDNISGGAGTDSLDGGLGADVISGGIGADTITGGVGNDTLTGGEGADVFVFVAGGGVDSITDFVTATDDLDMTTGYLAAVGTETATTAAGAGDSITLVDNDVRYISTNGAAANLTTGGTLTLNVADLTASTLTNLAAYLDERIATSTTNTDDAILVINWTAGGNVTSYIYEHVEANANATIQAAELTLLGVVTHEAGAILTTGDVI